MLNDQLVVADKGSYLLFPYLLSMSNTSHAFRLSKRDPIMTFVVSRDILLVATTEEIEQSAFELANSMMSRNKLLKDKVLAVSKLTSAKSIKTPLMIFIKVK